MVRDNSPKERQKWQLERKQGRRGSYDRILIVCEGSKTEVNYFEEIRIAHRLHTASVEVRSGKLGTAPIQVVQYANDLFLKGDRHKNIKPRAFERVYAVFDRDDHSSYDEALKLAALLDGKIKNDAKQSVVFRAIASVPCFELWLLLHYSDIQAPLRRDEVIRRLKAHIPNYEKGASGVFTHTESRLSDATLRAQKLSGRFSAETYPDPFTAIYELVTLLTTLRG